MITILKKLKEELQKIEYVKAENVSIAPHEAIVPNSAQMPCILIKDGRITKKELFSNMMEETLDVKIAVYVKIQKPEASIMGDPSTNQKGILEIVQEINSMLDENNLNIDNIQSAICISETESEPFLRGEKTTANMIQRKILTYQYIREVERT